MSTVPLPFAMVMRRSHFAPVFATRWLLKGYSGTKQSDRRFDPWPSVTPLPRTGRPTSSRMNAAMQRPELGRARALEFPIQARDTAWFRQTRHDRDPQAKP
jgi:hypothetical protein